MLIHLSSAGDGLVSDFGQILGKYDNVDNRCGDEMGLNGLWLLRLLWLAEMWRSQLLSRFHPRDQVYPAVVSPVRLFHLDVAHVAKQPQVMEHGE